MQIVDDEVEPMKEEVLRDLNPITEFCNYPKVGLDITLKYANIVSILLTKI